MGYRHNECNVQIINTWKSLKIKTTSPFWGQDLKCTMGHPKLISQNAPCFFVYRKSLFFFFFLVDKELISRVNHDLFFIFSQVCSTSERKGLMSKITSVSNYKTLNFLFSKCSLDFVVAV